ncbi:MAG: SMP-30/gluconolactonase/LRE family protein, partial [Caldimonas sp.]
IVVRHDGSIWFTDPPFGIAGNYEGDKSARELPDSVYRIDAGGKLHLVTAELAGPNGLAFTPDEKQLYVVESRAKPSRQIWRWDVDADGGLSNKVLAVDAKGPGALDGFAVDVDGNLWCGWGSDGSAGANPEDLDGVMVFDPAGQAIGFIRLPERCANVTFGGPKRNRLFMASSHSLYALYVETRGAAPS